LRSAAGSACPLNLGYQVHRKAERFAAVIRATSDADNKTISRYSRVLRYALRYKAKGRSLKAFIKKRGGVNGIASLFARHRTGTD
jgi:hypothetical protein